MIQTQHKDKPKGKSVLLFSGGLDSFIISKLEKIDILLYLRHGNRYEYLETHTINQLEKGGYLKGSKLVIKNNIDLQDFERDDAIIPLRNLFLLSMAALYGERLYIGAVYGDRTLDKSLEFLAKLEDMLNYLFQDQHWCESRKFEVLAPYKDCTKTELVSYYLDAGYDPKGLLVSYSCYEGKGGVPCWQCKACVRKAVALINNGIKVDGFDFNKVPWLQSTSDIYMQIMNNQWRGREDEDFKKAMSL